MTLCDQRSAKGRRHASVRLPLREPRLSGGWVAIVLSVLLAFSWQNFVTQTHVHHSHGPYPERVAGDTATPRLSIDQSPFDVSEDCQICQEIAQSGHYLPPTLIAFHPFERALVWLVATPAFATALRQSSHAWLSRAPPHPFHA